jgi:FtsZ-binding cell division protein ZapB
MKLEKAATFYDVVCAHYLANEPWKKERGVSSCHSRSHKVAFDHFPGIEGEDLRDSEQKKKRHADQAAGKKKRETAFLNEREQGRENMLSWQERLRGLVGKRVRVFWPKDDRYYAGTVKSYRRETTGKRRHLHTIHYDDDQTETLNLAKETWYEDDDDASDSEPVAKKPKGLHEERIEALKDKEPDPW